MKVSIRRSVFETNSSSMHCFTYQDLGFDRVKRLEFPVDEEGNCWLRLGEYGWGYDAIISPEEKFTYLLTDAIQNAGVYYGLDDEKTVDSVEYRLNVNSGDVALLIDIVKKYNLNKEKIKFFKIYKSTVGCFGVDHQSAEYILDELKSSSTKYSIEDFVFDPNIVLVITNDNTEDGWEDGHVYLSDRVINTLKSQHYPARPLFEEEASEEKPEEKSEDILKDLLIKYKAGLISLDEVRKAICLKE